MCDGSGRPINPPNGPLQRSPQPSRQPAHRHSAHQQKRALASPYPPREHYVATHPRPTQVERGSRQPHGGRGHQCRAEGRRGERCDPGRRGAPAAGRRCCHGCYLRGLRRRRHVCRLRGAYVKSRIRSAAVSTGGPRERAQCWEDHGNAAELPVEKLRLLMIDEVALHERTREAVQGCFRRPGWTRASTRTPPMPLRRLLWAQPPTRPPSYRSCCRPGGHWRGRGRGPEAGKWAGAGARAGAAATAGAAAAAAAATAAAAGGAVAAAAAAGPIRTWGTRVPSPASCPAWSRRADPDDCAGVSPTRPQRGVLLERVRPALRARL
jgi:hypothetical protein